MARNDPRHHIVRIDHGLWEWIRVYLEENPHLGYGDSTEFIKDVIRQYLKEHGPTFQPVYNDDLNQKRRDS